MGYRKKQRAHLFAIFPVISFMQFEDLEAWKKARKLVSHVYGLCRQPSLTRDYGIKDQIRRASVSVMSNLAEGFERTHKAEKIYLYKIARASAGEVRSLLYVIEDQEAAEADQLEELRKLVDAVGKLVTGLIRSTEKYVIGK